MESILAVINTTELVVEMRPEKNSGPYEIWTHDLCDTGAATSSAVFITARIDSIFVFSTAVNTYDFHMFILFTTSENSTCDCQVSFFIKKILSNHCHTDRPIASVNDNWYCLLHTEMKDIWSRNEQSGVTMRPRNKKKSKRLSQSVILSLHQASMPLYSVWENARGVLRLCTMNMVFQGIPSLLWHKTWKTHRVDYWHAPLGTKWAPQKGKESWSVCYSISQSVSQSVSPAVSQSANQSISHSFIHSFS